MHEYQADKQRLSNLLHAYRDAPQEFQATSYWESYEKDVLATISAMNLDESRSGRYKIFSTFGNPGDVFEVSGGYFEGVWQRGNG